MPVHSFDPPGSWARRTAPPSRDWMSGEPRPATRRTHIVYQIGRLCIALVETNEPRTPLEPARRVAVIGAGAAGTLTAIHLLRTAMATGRPLEVQLVERRGQHGLGRGVAYGTQDARHRLNVPAAGMTALPDEPDHFLRWCEANERPT